MQKTQKSNRYKSGITKSYKNSKQNYAKSFFKEFSFIEIWEEVPMP